MNIKKRALLKAQSILKKHKVTYPIDIIKIAKDEGFEIYESLLPDKISGILEPFENKIYIKTTDAETRKRFTIAHELGHYFLNHCDGIHVDKTFRDTRSSEGLYEIEIEANNFAAEILMPTDEINKKLKSYSNNDTTSINIVIDDLTKHFNVSNEAIKNKLKNMGYIIDIEYF